MKKLVFIVLLLLPVWCYGHDPTVDFGYEQIDTPIDLIKETSASGEMEVTELYALSITTFTAPSLPLIIEASTYDSPINLYKCEEVGWRI